MSASRARRGGVRRRLAACDIAMAPDWLLFDLGRVPDMRRLANQ